MAWELTGNAGTNASTNFVGTTDAQPLVFRVNGAEAMRADINRNIGIGTSSPLASLEVAGDWNGTDGALRISGDKPTIRFAGGSITDDMQWLVHLGSDNGGSLQIFKRGAGWDNWDHVMTFTPAGIVGVGTSNPGERGNGRMVVQVKDGDAAGMSAVIGVNDVADPATAGGGGWFESQQGEGVRGVSANANHGGVVGVNSAGGDAGFFDGNLHVTGHSTCDGNHTARGTVTALDMILAGSDCAENFDIVGDVSVEPGSVMVLADDGRLQPCTERYDRRVAGVISGAGDFKPGVILGNAPTEILRQPIALLGKVFCRVDAALAPISVGDLLTTSSTPGHAMRVNDHNQAQGAVLGKAMRPLACGQGLIPILVALR